MYDFCVFLFLDILVYMASHANRKLVRKCFLDSFENVIIFNVSKCNNVAQKHCLPKPFLLIAEQDLCYVLHKKLEKLLFSSLSNFPRTPLFEIHARKSLSIFLAFKTNPFTHKSRF